MSAYWVTLIGKIMCYAIVALAHGPDLGLRRHPVARARPVLRARRLRHGHVPDAPDRPRRPVPGGPARLHGVPRLEGAALAVVEHRPVLVGRAAGRRWCRGCSRSCSATSPSARASRACTSRSSRRRSPSPRCCCSSATTPASAATTASPTSSASSAIRITTPETRMALFALTGAAAARDAAARALDRRPRKFGRVLAAIRDAEARVDVLRLQHACTTSSSSGRSRRCCAASPARSTCRRSASSTRARCRPRTRSRSRSGWRSAAAARWSAPILGAGLVNGAKSFFTAGLSRVLAVRAGRDLHRWSRCSCRTAWWASLREGVLR